MAEGEKETYFPDSGSTEEPGEKVSGYLTQAPALLPLLLILI